MISIATTSSGEELHAGAAEADLKLKHKFGTELPVRLKITQGGHGGGQLRLLRWAGWPTCCQ